VQSFEEVRSHINAKHTLRINDPYLICFDITLEKGQRHQGLYVAELDDEAGRNYLRISTPIGPLTGMDAKRCLRFNWEQRVGYLAVDDLDGSPYLHLCENRPYELLSPDELERLIDEIGSLGDKLEQAISSGGDSL
jgi:hypothetical protein